VSGGFKVMSEDVAGVVVGAIGAYLAIGAVFAFVFLWRWVGALDPAATHGTLGFRALVFPGIAALWPIFVVRLLSGEEVLR
jgi:hypothetical protein